MAFTAPNSANIASNDAQRVAEVNDWASALNTTETAITNPTSPCCWSARSAFVRSWS